MSTFLSLLKKELRTCFLSPIAFVVMFFFWVLMGGNFYWTLFRLASGESLTFATQLMLGGPILPFVVPVVVPLITMRLFAEERKLGTLEALLTTAVKVPELVLSKFAGALIFYVVLWLPAVVYFYIQVLVVPDSIVGFPNGGAFIAGFIGVILIGALYLSVGLLMSSLTSNQIVAAIGGFAVLFGVFIATMYIAYLSPNPNVKPVGEFFSSFTHMMEFSRGIVDSRIVVLYLSFTAWILFATVRVVETRRA